MRYNMIRINTDAAYNPVTKEAGIGIIIQDNDDRKLYKIFVAHASDNHMVEFLALYESLQILKAADSQEIIAYQSDSKIVIDSIDKKFAKQNRYNNLLQDIVPLIEQHDMFFATWVPESQNKGADQLAKQALRKEGNLLKSIDSI